jgi:hypothetical protein
MRRVVIGCWLVSTGCVDVPVLQDRPPDAGSLGTAALAHRVDAAVAPWAPVLPGCGGGSSGRGGEGAGQDGGASGANEGLDAGTEPGSGPGPSGLPGPSAAGAVLITELMSDPRALPDAQGEWFELFNPGPEALELRGCLIDDGGATARAIGSAFVIEPDQYRAVARSAAPGFVPDLVATFSLGNDADRLGLQCGGRVIDEVSYSASRGSVLKAGASLALDPLQLDAALNDLDSAWCPAVTAYSSDLGTPGQPNDPCPASE